MVADQLQLRSNPIRTRLRTIDTPTEPRQPRRFEKNKNIALPIASGLPLATSADVQSGCHVAIAGWSIRKEQSELFAADGSHLQRYASRFTAVEINSSFYRSHKRDTYQRWAAAVPQDFRFAVKMPKTLTHEHCLEKTGDGPDRLPARGWRPGRQARVRAGAVAAGPRLRSADRRGILRRVTDARSRRDRL